MPLSKSDRAKLERHVKDHVEEVARMRERRTELARRIKGRQADDDDPFPKKGSGIRVLKEQLVELDREIAKHLELIELGRNEAMIAALGELVDNPRLVEEAAPDPRAYASQRGIEVPGSMELSVTMVDDHPRLTVFNYDRQAPLQLVWDRNGFSVGGR